VGRPPVWRSSFLLATAHSDTPSPSQEPCSHASIGSIDDSGPHNTISMSSRKMINPQARRSGRIPKTNVDRGRIIGKKSTTSREGMARTPRRKMKARVGLCIDVHSNPCASDRLSPNSRAKRSNVPSRVSSDFTRGLWRAPSAFLTNSAPAVASHSAIFARASKAVRWPNFGVIRSEHVCARRRATHAQPASGWGCCPLWEAAVGAFRFHAVASLSVLASHWFFKL
jgi:hypothetical protein